MGWRCLPYLVCANIGYKVDLETEEGVLRIKAGETLCVKPWVRHRITVGKGKKGEPVGPCAVLGLRGDQHFHLIDPPQVLKGWAEWTLGEEAAKKGDSGGVSTGASGNAPASALSISGRILAGGRDDLAKLTGLSASRFDVLFRTALGMPSEVYVQSLRFQVAQRARYADPFPFSKIFKKQAGMSQRASGGGLGTGLGR